MIIVTMYGTNRPNIKSDESILKIIGLIYKAVPWLRRLIAGCLEFHKLHGLLMSPPHTHFRVEVLTTVNNHTARYDN
jgi:hypothetical protein